MRIESVSEVPSVAAVSELQMHGIASGRAAEVGRTRTGHQTMCRIGMSQRRQHAA